MNIHKVEKVVVERRKLRDKDGRPFHTLRINVFYDGGKVDEIDLFSDDKVEIKVQK